MSDRYSHFVRLLCPPASRRKYREERALDILQCKAMQSRQLGFFFNDLEKKIIIVPRKGAIILEAMLQKIIYYKTQQNFIFIMSFSESFRQFSSISFSSPAMRAHIHPLSLLLSLVYHSAKRRSNEESARDRDEMLHPQMRYKTLKSNLSDGQLLLLSMIQTLVQKKSLKQEAS